MEKMRLYVSAPIACFRVAQAREYWETYPCPPPATIYGMLLSMVGEEDRDVHIGAELAIALLSEPQRSTVLRTLWRVKDKKLPPGSGNNKRPDFQELLSPVSLSVWVRKGAKEITDCPLIDRVNSAFCSPASISRFGGLSLGESTHLVDEVRRWKEDDPAEGRMLVADLAGNLSLPLWADHVGSKGTSWGQFGLSEKREIGAEPEPNEWIAIKPPIN